MKNNTLKKFVQTILTSFQEHNGKGSGKRLSLFVFVALITFATVFFTNEENVVHVIGELGLLSVAFAGVSAHYKNKGIKFEEPTKEEKNEPEV